MPVDRAQQRVDVDEHLLIGAGQQIDPLTQRHQVLAQDRLELAGMTEGELPQQRSHRRGCVHAVEQRSSFPPLRTTSMSSIQSAPAHMPATTVASFGAGLAAPDLIRGSAMRTFSAEQPRKPRLLGQRHHRHQPGIGHEMIIIKHRRTHSEPMRHFHRQCLSELGRLMREELQSSQFRGHFHRSDTLTNRSTSVDRGLGARIGHRGLNRNTSGLKALVSGWGRRVEAAAMPRMLSSFSIGTVTACGRVANECATAATRFENSAAR